MTEPAATSTAAHDWSSPAAKRRVAQRYRRDRVLEFMGLGAIGVAVVLLLVLLVSLFLTGAAAFTTTKLELPIFLDPVKIDRANPAETNYGSLTKKALLKLFPEVTSRREQRKLRKILSANAAYKVRDYVLKNPGRIGTEVTLTLAVSDPYDQLYKGVIPRKIRQNAKPGAPLILNPRFGSEKQLAWFDRLSAQNRLSSPFSWELFTNADSRFPEQAGLLGALSGSFFALLVCFMLSFPVGISAAIYLEEFAPKNTLSDLIEVNINNLAAVPSVVFGLLGLAVFLGTFGLPRSSPLVGGMVLSLMTLPTIIIATRAALKAVPPSVREAALGVGASRHQVIMHHVLPLAMPGILTGTIIGLAQALGETAPLLLIGMNAFIPSVENIGLLDPATALPTQIYAWADSPERGFVSRTSAAIVVLLGFLISMNAIAIFLRQKFQRRW